MTAALRVAGRAVLALALAGGLLAAPSSVEPVRAAAPNLTISSDARYDVQPAQRRIRINLDLLLTNHLKDTVTRRYYFDRAFLAVLPNTSAFKLSWDGNGTPSVHVSKRTKDYTLLRLDLGQRLFSGKSAHYKLRFDLVDPGGAPTRDVRVGDTLVSFPVWAFATDSTPGSSVKVVFPAGFSADVEAGSIPDPTVDSSGRTIYQTGKLDRPLSFFAYLIADRPGAYSERTVSPVVGGAPVHLTIRSWPDDETWSTRVGDLVGQALPVLSEQIGLPWPRSGGLTVQEAVSRSTGGYAGLFDPTRGMVEVAYYAGDFVVLHEAAHAWFNGALLADRWANEAFASYYGLAVAPQLKVTPTGDVLTPALEAARIPLNEWGAIGRESSAVEDYAYAATLTLAKAIAARAGTDGLRAVWADAAARVGAYQPPAVDGVTPGAPEAVDGPPDWRGLLDLLDEHGSGSFDDLWRTWVARPSDLPLLDARRAARARYDTVVAAARDWQLPSPVRDAMRAWRFDTATALLDDATRILEQRTAIDTAATASGLTPPDSLQRAFELPDGFATATDEAAMELESIHRYDVAASLRPTAPDLLQTLGLWGATPDAALDQAQSLFATGDLGGSAAAAADAAATWSGAEDLGRGRLVSLGALALAAFLAVVLFGLWLRGQRRRHRALAPGWVSEEPYATLAATPDDRGDRPGLMGLSRLRPSHEILSGDSADVYFARAETILAQEGMDPLVTMEVFTRQAGILCGIDEARNLLGHVLASAAPGEAQLEALQDGDVIAPKEIVLRIRARYRQFGLYETAFLGMLAQSTGWATAARACVEMAAPDPVISFGARHIHPDIADVLDYAAIVGGCVGASTPAGARLAGLAPTGTMPHSLVLIFGDTVEAALAFDRHVAPEVPRIVLVDTFKDEAEEALRVARALGDRLYGIRLDTPSERGRVTPDLVHEIRARLDQAGFQHVKITVSGGMNPERIAAFKEAGGAGRLVRGRLVYQRCQPDRLHRRHQGDRRAADRQARPHPGPDRLASTAAGGPVRLSRRVGSRPRDRSRAVRGSACRHLVPSPVRVVPAKRNRFRGLARPVDVAPRGGAGCCARFKGDAATLLLASARSGGGDAEEGSA